MGSEPITLERLLRRLEFEPCDAFDPGFKETIQEMGARPMVFLQTQIDDVYFTFVSSEDGAVWVRAGSVGRAMEDPLFAKRFSEIRQRIRPKQRAKQP